MPRSAAYAYNALLKSPCGFTFDWRSFAEVRPPACTFLGTIDVALRVRDNWQVIISPQSHRWIQRIRYQRLKRGTIRSDRADEIIVFQRTQIEAWRRRKRFQVECQLNIHQFVAADLDVLIRSRHSRRRLSVAEASSRIRAGETKSKINAR